MQHETHRKVHSHHVERDEAPQWHRNEQDVLPTLREGRDQSLPGRLPGDQTWIQLKVCAETWSGLCTGHALNNTDESRVFTPESERKWRCVTLIDSFPKTLSGVIKSAASAQNSFRSVHTNATRLL